MHPIKSKIDERYRFDIITFLLLLIGMFITGTVQSTDIPENINVRITLTLTKVSGDNQLGPISKILGDRFVVKVVDTKGHGVEKASITFKITTQPNGVASGAKILPAGGTEIKLETDTNGEARAGLILGHDPGLYEVTATANNPRVVIDPKQIFRATAF